MAKKVFPHSLGETKKNRKIRGSSFKKSPVRTKNFKVNVKFFKYNEGSNLIQNSTRKLLLFPQYYIGTGVKKKVVIK